MKQFVYKCTKNQIEKAIRLGAELTIVETLDSYLACPSEILNEDLTDSFWEVHEKRGHYVTKTAAYLTPTIEEMRSWLELRPEIGEIRVFREYNRDNKLEWTFIIFDKKGDNVLSQYSIYDYGVFFDSRKEAMHSAIDTVFAYLMNEYKEHVSIKNMFGKYSKTKITALYLGEGIIRYIIEYKEHWYSRWRFMMDGSYPRLFNEDELKLLGYEKYF